MRKFLPTADDVIEEMTLIGMKCSDPIWLLFESPVLLGRLVQNEHGGFIMQLAKRSEFDKWSTSVNFVVNARIDTSMDLESAVKEASRLCESNSEINGVIDLSEI